MAGMEAPADCHVLTTTTTTTTMSLDVALDLLVSLLLDGGDSIDLTSNGGPSHRVAEPNDNT